MKRDPRNPVLELLATDARGGRWAVSVNHDRRMGVARALDASELAAREEDLRRTKRRLALIQGEARAAAIDAEERLMADLLPNNKRKDQGR